MVIALSYHDILLHEEDVATLKDGCWINDNIIAFFFEYLRQTILVHSDDAGIILIDPTVTQLLKMSTLPVSCELLDSIVCGNRPNWFFMAVNDSASRHQAGGSHWSLLLYSPSCNGERAVYHLDSLSSQQNSDDALHLANKLAAYFDQPPLNNFSSPLAIINQSNSCDCGVYCISFAEFLCEKIAEGDFAWRQSGLVSKDIEEVLQRKRSTLIKLIRELALGDGDQASGSYAFELSSITKGVQRTLLGLLCLKLNVGTFGTGAHGRQRYSFEFTLYLPVIAKLSRYTVTDRVIRIKLRKEMKEKWLRLPMDSSRQPWIISDFDLYPFEASDLENSDNEDEPKIEVNVVHPTKEERASCVIQSMHSRSFNLMHISECIEGCFRARMSSHCYLTSYQQPEAIHGLVCGTAITAYNSLAIVYFFCRKLFYGGSYGSILLHLHITSRNSVLKNPLVIYLLLYNMFQLAGFLYIFAILMHHYFWLAGDLTDSRWFALIIDRMALIQLVAWLEPLHACLGWVRSSAAVSLLQVFGRSLVLFCIVIPHPEIAVTSTTFHLLLAYSSIELLRYPHYLLSMVQMKSGLLTYLRYSMWIPLYPMGFACEGKLIVLALPYLQKSRRFSLQLPNAYNMSFDFPVLLQFYLLSMMFGFYHLMRHMYVQRRRVIGPNPSVGADQMGFFSFLPYLRSVVRKGHRSALKTSRASTRGVKDGSRLYKLSAD